MCNFKYSRWFVITVSGNILTLTSLPNLRILITEIHLQNSTLFKKNKKKENLLRLTNPYQSLKKKSAPNTEQVFLLAFLHKLNITWWTNQVLTWNTRYGGITLQLLVTHTNFNLLGSPERTVSTTSSVHFFSTTEEIQNKVTQRWYAVTVKVLTEDLLSQMYVCCLRNLQCECSLGSSHTKMNKAQHAMCHQQAVKFSLLFFSFSKHKLQSTRLKMHKVMTG